MQQTDNFTWSTSDVLGYGATSHVYKGREKKTGREYAIKVFNSRSAGTTFNDARKREFEVLRKVDHKNIIRFLNVEQEITSGRDVIVMELCTAGTLQSYLEEPFNLHGLEESELKLLIEHITAGMKHLHSRHIVHRDLKPGNITRTFTEDGSPVYKLTDFGAARELGSEEQFQSLCGTEEYLHPDIYERAILRMPHGKSFSATVDLWSIGVTLYQAATGELPFRPYGGARRNRETMLRITSEKPPGAISGMQADAHGAIQWRKELPKTCRLSQGFKRYFTPLLAGLLEHDSRVSCSFNRYFADVESLLSMRVIHLFFVSSASVHHLYIPPEKKFLTFEEEVTRYTGVPSSNQLILFEGAEFQVGFKVPARSYPLTTPTQPLVLLCKSLTSLEKMTIPHTCKPPRFKATALTDNDANLAKVCSKTMYDIAKTIRTLLQVQELIRLSVKWFISYLKSRLVKARLTCSAIESKLKCLKMSLEIFEEHCRQETSLLRVISKMIATPPVVQELTLYFIEINEKAKYLKKMQLEFEAVDKRLREFEKSIIGDEMPLSIFIDEGSRAEDRLQERIDMNANKAHNIYKSFKKNKTGRMTSSEQLQERQFEKQNLAELCESAIKLLLEHSVPASRKLHKESQTWFTNMNVCMKEIENCERKFASLKRRSEEQVEPVETLQRIYKNKMTEVENFLYDIAAKKSVESKSNSLSDELTNEESSSCLKQSPKIWREHEFQVESS